MGCLNTTGTMNVACVVESDIESNYQNSRLFKSLTHPISSDKFTIKDGIANFTIIDKVELDEGSVTIDKNKFMMKNNRFIQNYGPNYLGIVNIHVYKVSIENDLYENNTFQYKEAMDLYGAISINQSSPGMYSGAYHFYEYYSGTKAISGISYMSGHYFYPGPPILIK